MHEQECQVVSVEIFPKFIIMLMLLASSAFAYSLDIKVTVSQGTLAVGTNVTLVRDSVVLGSLKADSKGMASFNATPGSYFVMLKRGGYPNHVSLIEMGNADKATELNMRQMISYANAYGFITGPSDFSATTLSAYSDGKIVGKYKPNKDGYYFVQFLPSGSYDFVFESPGFDKETVQVYLEQANFLEVNSALAKTIPKNDTPPKPVGNIVLTAPEQAKAGTVITISLTQGSQPLANEKISVNTPAGAITVTTDSLGIARVNAAQEGEYSFAYGNLTSTTNIPLSAPKPAENASSEPPVATPDTPQQPAGNANQDGMGALVLLTMIGAVGVVAVCLFLLVMFVRKMKRSEPAHAEKPAEKAHEKKPAHAAFGPQPGFQPTFPVEEKLGKDVKHAKGAHARAHHQKKKK